MLLIASGARTAEKLIEHVLAVANWLRDNEYIPEGACVASSSWTAELCKDWRAITGSESDYEVERPRHRVEQARAIIGVAGEVDPRFKVLLALGADLRLGQVLRARRSQLDLAANTFTVNSRGKKRGTTILLTRGQRQAVEEALAGYLAGFESSAPDYPLFPGRFTTKAGVYAKPDGRPIHKQTIYGWFKQAELLAGVPHIPGRCRYGIRRVATDAFLEQGASLKALQLNGGWTSTQRGHPDAEVCR